MPPAEAGDPWVALRSIEATAKLHLLDAESPLPSCRYLPPISGNEEIWLIIHGATHMDSIHRSQGKPLKSLDRVAKDRGCKHADIDVSDIGKQVTFEQVIVWGR
jgi:hypothetical protein